jgi:pyrimidine operon attenuation protein/uracil phosphoribosyltransferase
MPQLQTLVLNEQQVALKIKRIAWEILERHASEDKLVMVGISKSGFWLATQVQKELLAVSDLEIDLVEMKINKKDPLDNAIELSMPLQAFDYANVVLIDDVLNSGKVLMYGIRHLLTQPLKKLTTAVLVDRNHKLFPVKADVKGLSLSTSMNEHVAVKINKNSAEVYLL